MQLNTLSIYVIATEVKLHTCTKKFVTLELKKKCYRFISHTGGSYYFFNVESTLIYPN